MDAGPMIDLCYRLQNPELFKADVPWIPLPNLAEVTARADDRPDDSLWISTHCEACGCDHSLPVPEAP